MKGQGHRVVEQGLVKQGHDFVSSGPAVSNQINTDSPRSFWGEVSEWTQFIGLLVVCLVGYSTLHRLLGQFSLWFKCLNWFQSRYDGWFSPKQDASTTSSTVAVSVFNALPASAQVIHSIGWLSTALLVQRQSRQPAALGLMGHLITKGLMNTLTMPSVQSMIYPPAGLEEGLVAFYPFDGNADDHSVNHNHGVVSSATLTTDRFGNPESAYAFDGNSSYITVMNGTAFDFVNSFSVSMWLKPGATQMQWSRLFSKSHFSNGGTSWTIRQHNTELNEYDVAYKQAASNSWYETARHYIATDKWSHYVVTKEDVTVKAYINGQQVSDSTGSSGPLEQNGALPLYIGASQYNGEMGTFYNGLLDEIFLYDRTLTVEEVVELYLFGVPTSQPSSQPSSSPTIIPTKIESTTEFQVNTYVTNEQTNPVVTGLSNGDYVVAWMSNGQDGAENEIYVQRYSAEGMVITPAARVNTVLANNQISPAIAALTDGGLVITWSSISQDGSLSGIYGQRYFANLTKFDEEHRINNYTLNDQSFSSVTGLANGGYACFWQSSGQDTSSWGIYGQLYQSDNHQLGEEFRVNDYALSFQKSVASSSFSTGEFVVVWSSNLQDGSGSGIYGQCYEANGAISVPEFRITEYVLDDQDESSVAVLRDDKFVVVWQSVSQDGDGLGIYGQRFLINGTRVGVEFLVNTRTGQDQNLPSVASLNDGGFVVVWQSELPDGSGVDIYGQRYLSNGLSIGANFRVNTYVLQDQSNPQVAGLQAGGFVVVWQSDGQDGSSWGIYGQQYDANGYSVTRYPTSQPSSMPSGQPTTIPTEAPSSQPSTLPTVSPTRQPTSQPSHVPSVQPSGQPSVQPSNQPTRVPSTQPTTQPSVVPTRQPSSQPSVEPTGSPSTLPTVIPTTQPSQQPLSQPTTQPSVQPTDQPSTQPSGQPTTIPTKIPSSQPSTVPTGIPTNQPSSQPTGTPSTLPTVMPTTQPSVQPSGEPTSNPTLQPSVQPSGQPTTIPTKTPSSQPSTLPTVSPTQQPTSQPSDAPTIQPSGQPSVVPTRQPSSQPSVEPTGSPSTLPTVMPTTQPSQQPLSQPTTQPSVQPTDQPSMIPTSTPSGQPTSNPTLQPSVQPSGQPTTIPTKTPSSQPSTLPTVSPTQQPTSQPSHVPSVQPSTQPSVQPSNPPTRMPSTQPTIQPSTQPSVMPTSWPTSQPTSNPSTIPTLSPTTKPSSQPLADPTSMPTVLPTNKPIGVPTLVPTAKPTQTQVATFAEAIDSFDPQNLTPSLHNQRYAAMGAWQVASSPARRGLISLQSTLSQTGLIWLTTGASANNFWQSAWRLVLIQLAGIDCSLQSCESTALVTLPGSGYLLWIITIEQQSYTAVLDLHQLPPVLINLKRLLIPSASMARILQVYTAYDDSSKTNGRVVISGLSATNKLFYFISDAQGQSSQMLQFFFSTVSAGELSIHDSYWYDNHYHMVGNYAGDNMVATGITNYYVAFQRITSSFNEVIQINKVIAYGFNEVVFFGSSCPNNNACSGLILWAAFSQRAYPPLRIEASNLYRYSGQSLQFTHACFIDGTRSALVLGKITQAAIILRVDLSSGNVLWTQRWDSVTALQWHGIQLVDDLGDTAIVSGKIIAGPGFIYTLEGSTGQLHGTLPSEITLSSAVIFPIGHYGINVAAISVSSSLYSVNPFTDLPINSNNFATLINYDDPRIQRLIPTLQPTSSPTAFTAPSSMPSTVPSSQPSSSPTVNPTSSAPTQAPHTSRPTFDGETHTPTAMPTSSQPTSQPTGVPSAAPTTSAPTVIPTRLPSVAPTSQPSTQPSVQPSCVPSGQPSLRPTGIPTQQPNAVPTSVPSAQPSTMPSAIPTTHPILSKPKSDDSTTQTYNIIIGMCAAFVFVISACASRDRYVKYRDNLFCKALVNITPKELTQLARCIHLNRNSMMLDRPNLTSDLEQKIKQLDRQLQQAETNRDYQYTLFTYQEIMQLKTLLRYHAASILGDKLLLPEHSLLGYFLQENTNKVSPKLPVTIIPSNHMNSEQSEFSTDNKRDSTSTKVLTPISEAEQESTKDFDYGSDDDSYHSSQYSVALNSDEMTISSDANGLEKALSDRESMDEKSIESHLEDDNPYYDDTNFFAQAAYDPEWGGDYYDENTNEENMDENEYAEYLRTPSPVDHVSEQPWYLGMFAQLNEASQHQELHEDEYTVSSGGTVY